MISVLFIYKCKNCNESFTPIGATMEKYEDAFNELTGKSKNLVPALTSKHIHHCKIRSGNLRGTFGIGELSGMEIS